MSISVILRARGATSGGEIKDIAGDGNIDNQAEAQAALGLIANSDSVVIIGGESYDRTRLERIRDGQGSGAGVSSSGQGAGLSLGFVHTSQDIPSGSRLYVFINGNPSQLIVGGVSRDSLEITADRRPEVVLPASTPDSPPDHPHTVEYRISRPGLPEARDTRPLIIRPALATLTNASVVPPTSGTSFGRDTIRVKFTTNRATEHKVRVRIGTHTEDVTVPAGTAAAGATREIAPLALSGEPRTWMDAGGTPARNGRYTVTVTITPLAADGKEGTAVNAGSVTIIRQAVRRSSGQRTTTTTTTVRPPRL